MRVVLDQSFQRGVRELHVALLQAVLFKLAWNEMTFCDLDFLRRRVARNANRFETIAQRRVNWVEPVRGGDEEHLRKIERNVEVMIAERVILRRVEDFEQRRRRIAAEIRADFVEF